MKRRDKVLEMKHLPQELESAECEKRPERDINTKTFLHAMVCARYFQTIPIPGSTFDLSATRSPGTSFNPSNHGDHDRKNPFIPF